MNRIAQHLAADRRGVAALEAALLLPVLLLLVLGGVDLVFEIRTWYRLDEVTTELSQMISQCTSINTQDIQTFMADGQILANPTQLTGSVGGTLIISAVENNSSGKTIVIWQQASNSLHTSSIGTVGGAASLGSYVLPDDEVLIGVEAIATPTIWQFAASLMGAAAGKAAPQLYSQSMFLSRITSTSGIVSVATSTSGSGACTS